MHQNLSKHIEPSLLAVAYPLNDLVHVPIAAHVTSAAQTCIVRMREAAPSRCMQLMFTQCAQAVGATRRGRQLVCVGRERAIIPAAMNPQQIALSPGGS